MATPTLDYNPQFLRAVSRVAAGSSVFITGRAGTGKSTLLQHLRSTLTERHPVVVAPTGVAAVNVRGQTIHSFFGFKPDVSPRSATTMRPRSPQLYAQLRTLIIDEVSMVRADLLDSVDQFLRRHGPVRNTPFGGVQLVLVGDLHQLPPVVARTEAELFRTAYASPYFFSAQALQGLELEVVELETVYRQRDDAFIRLLNAVRDRSVSADDLAALNARVGVPPPPSAAEPTIWLTPTNAQADALNATRIAALPGDVWTSLADVHGDFERSAYPTAETLELKRGAQVMLLSNDGDGRWVNGTVGVVEDLRRDVALGEELAVVRLETGQRVEVERHTWELFRTVLRDGHLESEPIGSFTQLPLRLAFAVTIHKSQGKTFSRVVLDLGRGAFAPGQLYVALSRCTTLEGLTLTTPIRLQDVRTDPEVLRFAQGMRDGMAPTSALPSGAQLRLDAPVAPVAAAAATPARSDLGTLVDRLRLAIERHQRLRLTYEQVLGSTTERLVEPRRLAKMEQAGHAFLGLEAFCLQHEDVRTFNVARIRAVGEVA